MVKSRDFLVCQIPALSVVLQRENVPAELRRLPESSDCIPSLAEPWSSHMTALFSLVVFSPGLRCGFWLPFCSLGRCFVNGIGCLRHLSLRVAWFLAFLLSCVFLCFAFWLSPPRTECSTAGHVFFPLGLAFCHLLVTLAWCIGRWLPHAVWSCPRSATWSMLVANSNWCWSNPRFRGLSPHFCGRPPSDPSGRVVETRRMPWFEEEQEWSMQAIRLGILQSGPHISAWWRTSPVTREGEMCWNSLFCFERRNQSPTSRVRPQWVNHPYVGVSHPPQPHWGRGVTALRKWYGFFRVGSGLFQDNLGSI